MGAEDVRNGGYWKQLSGGSCSGDSDLLFQNSAIPTSGGLEIVSGTKDLGDGIPQRAEPRWGLGAKPQKLTTYFENNYRKHRLMRPLH